MQRSAILTFLVGCCAFCFSQQLSFSRQFQAIKKNVPIAIINTQPDCFYVLRYNKGVHDFTIERRAKPSAEIIGFTPLKLDSVNATWFDYEKLDYLFFEEGRRLYFVFEKVVNTKKTIYLKIIDTLSRSSGFIELASLEKDKGLFDVGFEFSQTAEHNILIVASQISASAVRKTAMLYDIHQRKMRWTKKMPLENTLTGYSTAFESNHNDLFYVLVKSRIISYQRRYLGNTQVNVPVLFYDSLTLVSYAGDPPSIYKKALAANVIHLNSVLLQAGEDHLQVQMHYSLHDEISGESYIYFLHSRLSTTLEQEIYTTNTQLNGGLKQQLTFYDGGDSKLAEDKAYSLFRQFRSGHYSYQVAERRDDNYYKELLVWQTDLENGLIKNQYLVPRKTMIFKGRTRLKNIGAAIPVFYNGQLSLVVLEATGNLKKPADEFDFHKFKKETNLWRSNLVMYTIKENGSLEKSLLYHNADFDLAPVNYDGKSSDVMFYLSSGKYEKFAILKLNP